MADVEKGKVIEEKAVNIALTENELKIVLHGVLNYRGWVYADMGLLQSIVKKVEGVLPQFQVKEKE